MGKVSAHGFVSYAADGSPTYLPLSSVSAKIYIVDVSARVVLTQVYTNDHNIRESASAQYIFPVPANGAVCAFKMQSADGRVVKGVVKERSKAEQEYEIALSQNQFAGLLYEATPDIFVISIGAIPQGQDVEVTIMYVIALSDGDLPGYDQVEFSLPTYIATRYGTPPPALTGPSSSSVHTSLDISAEIQMPTSITSVTSSSHAITVYTSNVTNSPSPIYTSRVTLDPAGLPPKLNRDFVLSIQAAKLGQPRCVAEVGAKEMSVALSLTFVPRFRMQTLPTQEYVFLIDRSGSMAGSRIRYAKEALLLFLKSLPSQGTLFNIFSFGSHSSSLWPSSRKYTASDINIALSHVNAMDANMGGTEIQSGLADALRSRNPSVPMAVFVLTDGEIYELDSLLALVSNEVAKSRTSHNGVQTHLRFFTLGVGVGASTALCEGIARNGNGLCLMTTESGDISQKCARLLLASKIAPSANAGDVVVDWGYVPANAWSSNTINNHNTSNGQYSCSSNNKGNVTVLYDESCDPLSEAMTLAPVVLPDSQGIQQAPSRVPDLYPANRFTVSAILSNTLVVPKTVTLRGTLPDGSIISLPPIKVCQTLDQQRQGQDAGDLPPLIHTLAAHRIIQELEDGNTDSQGPFDRGDEGLCEMVAMEAIVRLSEGYQLASKFASFIAVEGEEEVVQDDDNDDDDDVEDYDGDAADVDVDVGNYDRQDGRDSRQRSPVPDNGVNNDDDRQDGRGSRQRSPVPDGVSNDDDDADDDGFYEDEGEDEEDARQSNPANVNVGNVHGSPVGGWSGVGPSSPPVHAFKPQSNNVAFPQSSGMSTSGPLGLSIPSSQSDMSLSQQSKNSRNAMLNQCMPGAYPIDDTLSSSRAHGTVPQGQITDTLDLSCPSHGMPGAYPHGGVLLSGRGVDYLVPPSDQRRESTSTLTPYPLHEGPQSDLYSLEVTAVCLGSPEQNLSELLPSDSPILGALEEDELMELEFGEAEEVASPPLFKVTASSKTGLYKALKKLPKPTAIAPVPWTTGAPIIAAARLQSFDGSFELDDNLHALIGKKFSLQRLKTVIPARLKGQQDADKIWATVLAAAYLNKALPDDKEVWIGLWNKAAEYVEMKLDAGLSFAGLVDEASKLL